MGLFVLTLAGPTAKNAKNAKNAKKRAVFFDPEGQLTPAGAYVRGDPAGVGLPVHIMHLETATGGSKARIS